MQCICNVNTADVYSRLLHGNSFLLVLPWPVYVQEEATMLVSVAVSVIVCCYPQLSQSFIEGSFIIASIHMPSNLAFRNTVVNHSLTHIYAKMVQAVR